MSANALLIAWQQTLARLGNQPAIKAPDGTTLRTFSDVEAEARGLEKRCEGFPRHAVIAVQIGNVAVWPGLLLALFRARLVSLPLGRHLDASEVEVALQTCDASGLITAHGDELRITNRKSRFDQQWKDSPPDFLKLTSGTTSAPRAIRFRASQLLADCDNICATMGITAADVNFGVIPFSHSYGFSNLITPLIARGIRLVASEDRLPRAILNDLAASKATVFPGMPVFYQKIVELETVPALPNLRLCISAGAPLSKVVAERFAAKFGRKIHTFYGASECGGIAYDAEERAVHDEGFAGKAMHGVEIERVETAGAASIVVRSAAVGDGYYPNSDETTLSRGQFAPSDLVRWTDAGMFIVGRVSDVINVAGRKLNPLELERRLLACPGIKQAVVFGVTSSLRGEEPVACVTVEPGIDSAIVLRFCQTQLSAWQVPKDIWIVDDIPVNERGKINRRFLAERYRTREARCR